MAAEHRHVVGGGGPAQPGQDAGRERGVPGARARRAAPTGPAPIAARSLTLTSTEHQPAHSRVALHHRRDDRVAGGDHVGAGHRRRRRRRRTRARPGQPGAIGRCRPARPAARPAGSWSSAASAARRPIGHRISTCGAPGHARPAGPAASPAGGRSVPAPAWTVASNRSAPACSACAQAARTRSAPARPRRGRRVDHQPPAVPPADVRAAGPAGPSRTPPITRAVRCPRHQHHGARVVVVVVGVIGLEQALLGHEHPGAQRPVGGQRGRVRGRLDQERGPAGRLGRIAGQAGTLAGKDLEHAPVLSRPPPAARCTPRTPRSPPAGPPRSSRPRCSSAATRCGHVPDQRRRRGRRRRGRASVPTIGRIRHHERVHAPLDQPPRPRPPARPGPRPARSAGRWRPGCGRTPAPPRPRPPRTRSSAPIALPGIHRLPDPASSSDSTWMPIAVAPASRRSREHGQVGRAARHCTWIGSPGTAASTARTHRARWRAPRSGPAVVPVVITICRTPSSRTAASATSASWAGVLAAIVRPGAQRLLDGAEPAPVVLGVADAGLHHRGGQHVARRAAGRSAGTAPRRRWSGRRTWAARTTPQPQPGVVLAQPDPTVAHRVRAVRVDAAARRWRRRRPGGRRRSARRRRWRWTGASIRTPRQREVDPGVDAHALLASSVQAWLRTCRSS